MKSGRLGLFSIFIFLLGKGNMKIQNEEIKTVNVEFLVPYIQKLKINDIVHLIPKKYNLKETKLLIKSLMMMNFKVVVKSEENFIIRDNKEKLFLIIDDSCSFNLTLVIKISQKISNLCTLIIILDASRNNK